MENFLVDRCRTPQVAHRYRSLSSSSSTRVKNRRQSELATGHEWQRRLSDARAEAQFARHHGGAHRPA